jgi:hypothetical protein
MKKLILFFVLLFNFNAEAQSIKFSQSPIDYGAKKLSPNFIGHDPSQVYRLFDTKSFNRGKYETRDKWMERQLNIADKPFFGSVYQDSLIGFSVKPSFCDYNADTKDFAAHFVLYKGEITRDYGNGEKFVEDGLKTTTSIRRTFFKKYNVTNPFGVKTTVTSQAHVASGFSFNNWDRFPFIRMSSSKYRISYKASLPPVNAQRLEKNIAVLYLGFMDLPYQGREFQSIEATFDSPWSDQLTSQYACFRLAEIWFYDYKSGYIYKKIKPPTVTEKLTPAPKPMSKYEFLKRANIIKAELVEKLYWFNLMVQDRKAMINRQPIDRSVVLENKRDKKPSWYSFTPSQINFDDWDKAISEVRTSALRYRNLTVPPKDFTWAYEDLDGVAWEIEIYLDSIKPWLYSNDEKSLNYAEYMLDVANKAQNKVFEKLPK